MTAAPAVVRRIDWLGQGDPTADCELDLLRPCGCWTICSAHCGHVSRRFRTGAGARMASTAWRIRMSAFSVFFMQSPSFLAHQRRMEEGHGRSNCQSLFGMGKIPSDNRIRDMLDPASPQLLNPLFFEIMSRLQGEQGGLDVFRRLEGHVLIALDGTEYFCSKEIDCPNCLTRRRGTSGTEYYPMPCWGQHWLRPATIRSFRFRRNSSYPRMGRRSRIARMRRPNAGLTAHGPRYAALKPIYLGDDLFSRQPLCEAVTAAGGDFIFTCKPSSHPLIQEYVAGGGAYHLRKDHQKGQKARPSPLSLALRHSSARWQRCLTVNWFEIEITDATGKVTYRNSFVTNLDVNAANVAELTDCGRARWKIENETFNVLKTKGYHLEHNFGHGKKNLSAVLVALEPACLRHAYSLRDRGRTLALGAPETRFAKSILQHISRRDGLPALCVVGRFSANHCLRQSAACFALIAARSAPFLSARATSREIRSNAKLRIAGRVFAHPPGLAGVNSRRALNRPRGRCGWLRGL